LRRLRKRFPDELVVVGVHSAKFGAERETANLAQAVARHGIEHPVVNDRDLRVWESHAVRAWPTVVLIDPQGRVVARQAGEIDAGEVGGEIARLIEEAERKGVLDRSPRRLRPEAGGEPERLLSFPGKLLVPGGGRLFVADTAHHRVLELEVDPPRARPVRAFGSGEPAFADGAATAAAFHNPHGLALQGSTLLVADTDNHAVRAIDLGSGSVTTVAGTGEKGGYPPRSGSDARAVALRSPWGLLADGEVLLIAMAGSHQIWALAADGAIGPFAGNGREALVDGPRARASFNQPSDLALGMGHLFVADAEASAVRAVSFAGEPRVSTLVGQGLFEFGDRDGRGAEVRLQHPVGIAFDRGLVYVADSYNHKVKTLDPTTGEVRTLIGTGEPGLADGPFEEARLWEPEGLAVEDGRLWIADTNNHAIRVADLAGREVHTLKLTDGTQPAV
jgi:DNA-binding beta-propeller fold protein YncE